MLFRQTSYRDILSKGKYVYWASYNKGNMFYKDDISLHIFPDWWKVKFVNI